MCYWPAGNDFSTLYAPLIRDGRMEKFYWAPTREDRVGVCMGIFQVCSSLAPCTCTCHLPADAPAVHMHAGH